VVLLRPCPGVLFRKASRARADGSSRCAGRRGASSGATEGRADRRSSPDIRRRRARTGSSGRRGCAAATIIGSSAGPGSTPAAGVQGNTFEAVLSSKSAS
jgi:hypothetical protein